MHQQERAPTRKSNQQGRAASDQHKLRSVRARTFVVEEEEKDEQGTYIDNRRDEVECATRGNRLAIAREESKR